MFSILLLFAMVALSFLVLTFAKRRKKYAAFGMMAIGMLFFAAPAEAGNCGVNNFAAVQVGGFAQPAFVQSFGVPVHQNFVSSRGVFVAAPQVSPVFVQAVPIHRQFNAVNVRVNAVRGQQFRQVQTRGVFGRQRTVTTIR